VKLDQFLKWKGLAHTGGEAKMTIQSGDVMVNGEIEDRRGRKLEKGDIIELGKQRLRFDPDEVIERPTE
jgi:ribosome-associated protein